ncbi:zinc finger protein 490-like [Ptychodera flava]|uniref:zinc finger protein 490-like n=1 Tax=Ptychodera flava TaxID=63121 RepID=UPI003969BC01
MVEQCQTLLDAKVSRADIIDGLFDQGEELMEKLGCQVFILVSEDGICSNYMGSEVFLREFCSSGLKINPQDVPRIRKNTETQMNYWIAEDNGYGQQILLRSVLQTSYDKMPASCSMKENTASVTMVTGTNVSTDIEQRSEHEEGDDALLPSNKSCDAEDDSISNDDDNTVVPNFTLEDVKHESKNNATKIGCSMNDMKEMTENCPVEKETVSPVNDMMEREERCPSEKEITLRNNTEFVKKLRRKSKTCERQRCLRYYKFSPSDPDKHRRGIQKVFKEFYETKPNLCYKCGFSFRNPHGLEVHQQRAPCPGRRCKFCRVRFPFKLWQKHLLDEHVAELKIYECHVCEKQFLQCIELRCHLQIHEPEKTYICDICGHTLKTANSLATHKLMHEGKEFKCEFCDYKSVRKCDLMVHMQRHIDKSKLQCKECGKQVLSTNSLREHIQRFHTKLKYPCSDCGKEFCVPWELRHHVERHHSGDRNLLTCEKCDKGFHTKILLNAHLRVVHSQHPVKCQICLKEFRHHTMLKRHLRVHERSEVKKMTGTSHNYTSESASDVTIVTDTNQSSSDREKTANQQKTVHKRKGNTSAVPGNSKKRKAVKKQHSVQRKSSAKKPRKKQRKRKKKSQKCCETNLNACTICGFPFKKPIGLDEGEPNSRRRCNFWGTSFPVKEKQQNSLDNCSAEIKVNE